MAKDPAFLFYPGDYLRDTQCLSEKAQVSYDRIMCEHMRNICISQEQLNFFTKRLSEDEKNEVLFLLTKVKGGFQIHWVADSISKRRSYSESRAKNREGKNKKDIKTYVPHMEIANENEVLLDSNKHIEVSNGTWVSEKKHFLNAEAWQMKQCSTFGLNKEMLLKHIDTFLARLENQEDYKSEKELKRHFPNWYERNKDKLNFVSSLSPSEQERLQKLSNFKVIRE